MPFWLHRFMRMGICEVTPVDVQYHTIASSHTIVKLIAIKWLATLDFFLFSMPTNKSVKMTEWHQFYTIFYVLHGHRGLCHYLQTCTAVAAQIFNFWQQFDKDYVNTTQDCQWRVCMQDLTWATIAIEWAFPFFVFNSVLVWLTYIPVYRSHTEHV